MLIVLLPAILLLLALAFDFGIDDFRRPVVTDLVRLDLLEVRVLGELVLDFAASGLFVRHDRLPVCASEKASHREVFRAATE
jgi:hypothetical protein